jgi:hypothetical protein
MQKSDLERLVNAAKCRVFGWEDASNDPYSVVLGTLIQCFNHPDATILCEPSLARTSKRPPDVVLVDTIAGIHIIEVKGHNLQQIEAIEPGGQICFRYENGNSKRNPVTQARNAMFDIKNATEQSFEGELELPFKYWVAFPRIGRAEWKIRWGNDGYCPPEFLFADDMSDLADRIRSVGQKQLSNIGIERWPSDQIAAIWKAFGDSSVLHHRPEDRAVRKTEEGSLGEVFDEAAETYKTLSEEQQRLAASLGNETEQIIARLRWPIEDQHVRPQDILILSMFMSSIESIAGTLAKTKIKGVESIHVVFREQDKILGQRSTQTLSTTASAKGYDAYCVLMASGNEFDCDVFRRISFYVGCTRAIENLAVFAHRKEGLVVELERVLARQSELAEVQ